MSPYSKKIKVRSRFAPSPTGLFHIGNARTALFAYLFAKQNNGDFILRIEDTDLERSKKEFEDDISVSLKWLGLEWSEGPDIGGKYGPYRQSEKSKTYEKYIKQLLEVNKAYCCFCEQEELEAKRQDQMARGQAPRYDGKCSNLSQAEVKENLEQGKKFVIRLRAGDKKVIFHDLVRGEVETDVNMLGDFVIARSLENPLFYLAGVIDDEEMKITHVIRGEDHISNTPKQILIQEALGFEKPIYAHLPMILAPDRSKLSKRHGAVSVAEYKKQGYLPQTLVNFLAFLGWNPGDEREFFSLDSLAKDFRLEQVQKGGAIFNQKRLDFLNGFYIRQEPLSKLTELCIPYLLEAELIEVGKTSNSYNICGTGEKISFELLGKIVGIHQSRLKKLSEISEMASYFFKEKPEYSNALLKWQQMTDKETADALDKLEDVLSNIDEKNWDLKNLQNVLLLQAEQLSNRGYLLWPLRVALSGKEFSAGPFEIAEILGKEKTLKRIGEAKAMIK